MRAIVDLRIRNHLEHAYADVYTSEVREALAALVPLDRHRCELMAVRIERRRRRFEGVEPEYPQPRGEHDFLAEPWALDGNDSAPRPAELARPVAQRVDRRAAGLVVVHHDHAVFERVD